MRVRCESGRPLPSFFIVGPPRTGTSWLHEILGQHVILPHPTKETRFFDLHFDRGFDWYRDPFSGSDREQTGRRGRAYLFCLALRRGNELRAQFRRAKVVCIFRNPVERVVSLYRLKRAYGMIPWNFEEAIVRDSELMESGKYGS